MKTIKELVKEWNEAYSEMGSEIDFEALSDEGYEAEVASVLHSICGTWERALKVFNSPGVEGGWMKGDAEAYIKRKIKEEEER